METKKLVNYDRAKVQEALMQAFRRGTKEAAAADLARITGLPLSQIQAEMPAIVDEFNGRLRVSEKGDLLFSFPAGFRSKYRGVGPWLKKASRTALKWLGIAGKTLFKVWILVTLFGYFFLFIALALLAFFASIAVQAGGRGGDRDDRRGGLGGLWMTTRLFDTLIRLWFYSELFKDPQTRYREMEARKSRRPLHKAVFSHVFGDGDPEGDWEKVLKKAFIAYVQTHRGVITLPEFMAISGLSPSEAEERITSYLVEFEGTPEVSEQGTIYFFFPSLLAKVGSVSASAAATSPLRRLIPFSSNTPRMDTTFRLVNIFNLAFGGYYLSQALQVGANVIVRTADGIALRGGLSFLYSWTVYLAAQLGAAQPVQLVAWALGVAPLAFSVLFFAIPVVRAMLLRKRNEAIKIENLRRVLYNSVLASPEDVDPAQLHLPVESLQPTDASAKNKVLEELAAWSRAEPDEKGHWHFQEIRRIMLDVAKIRASIDESRYAPGATVFDTGDRV